MGEIMIVPVSKDNWYACTRLSVTKEQEELFPCSVVDWLAESKFETSFIPLSIYWGDVLIGFSVIGIEPKTNMMWIVAFMIDKDHQGKGYGRKAMKELIVYIKKNYKTNSITLGHRPNNHRAGGLYASLGFEVIKTTEKEVQRRLTFNV
jgi:diamine N-acetyltransferase